MSFNVPPSSTSPSVHQIVLMGTIHRHQTAPTKDGMAITSLPGTLPCAGLLSPESGRSSPHHSSRQFMTAAMHERSEKQRWPCLDVLDIQ